MLHEQDTGFRQNDSTKPLIAAEKMIFSINPFHAWTHTDFCNEIVGLLIKTCNILFNIKKIILFFCSFTCYILITTLFHYIL